MASGFAPEFLILVGIDIFLGASILTVLLDRYYPGPYPYILEGAALIGFLELVSGPSFLTSLSSELQFWYSFIYAMIAVLALFATNLYLLFLRRRPFESAVLAICGTVPAGLGVLYFTSAFVNGLTVSLPLVPEIPIEGVYAMFGLSIALVVFSLVVFGRRARRVVEPEPESEEQREEPIPARVVGSSVQLSLIAEKTESQRPPASSESPTETAAKPEVMPARTAPAAAEAPVEVRGDAGGATRVGPVGPAVAAAQQKAGAPRAKQGAAPKPYPDFQSSGTVLVEKPGEPTYRERLLDSMRFLEKAVDHPVRIDPSSLGDTFKEVTRAYLTPAGMVIAEDRVGKTVAMSLLDLPTDEALKVMTDAMREVGGSRVRER